MRPVLYSMPPLLPELDELLAQIAGEMEMGPLSDEERARIEEIERIRVSTQHDFWGQAGPVTGTCACGRPQEEGVQLCPQCDGRASRPG
ncbi:MAG: hypothetical protein JWM18_3023 [Chloroflexi bacterium]|nr:hypothetical protein [Chloroflexota bacterium]